MAEFVHSFQRGRMNKDLDERLVPNGEYRDALNLDLANSDASDVGAMQNIAGTIQLRSKVGTGATWTSGYIDAMTNPVCIGSYRDDINERIYWFIASDGISAIAEYDQVKNDVSSILVDTAGILNFSADYLITGINILDKFLFWTDDQTEPKKINIEKFKTGSTDFITQTKIPKWDANQNNYNTNLSGQPDFVEADVTTIKLSPLTAPTLSLAASKFGENEIGTGITPVNLTVPTAVSQETNGAPNFTYVPNPAVDANNFISLPTYGEYLANTSAYDNSSIGPGWDGRVTISITTIPSVWQSELEDGRNPLIIMSGSLDNDFNETFEYEVSLLITSISGSIITCEIQAISNNIIRTFDDEENVVLIQWEALISEEAPMFEYVFPRFAYRWKYIDNEYSTYSPFSSIAFLGGEFKYISSDGYNVGMTNNVRELIIESLDWGSEEVSEIDILYKESNSIAVYTVDTLKREEYVPYTLDALPTSFQVETELIGAVVESNQLLRPWDNVPRRAKSQEIIGNRIVYGNYLQNFNVGKIDLTLNIQKEAHPWEESLNTDNPQPEFIRMPFSSLKSIRTYQAGIVYKGAYGRETPVFTSKNASTKVSIEDSYNVTSLSVVSNALPPSWATHYKFFIKEISNEYYNLALDKFYPAEDGNVWLSFPSSERNKVDEQTYLILKKQHDNDVPVKTLNEYKILSIENEAPAFISQFQKTSTYAPGTLSPNDGVGPDFLSVVFTSADLEGPELQSGRLITFEKGSSITEAREINKVTKIGNVYTVILREALGPESTFLSPGDLIDINVVELVERRKPEFEGRFFVKINRNFAFDTNIIASFTAMQTRYGVKGSSIIATHPYTDGRPVAYDQREYGIADDEAFGNWYGDGGWNRNGIGDPPDEYRLLGVGAWNNFQGLSNGGQPGPTEMLNRNYQPPTYGSPYFGISYVLVPEAGGELTAMFGFQSGGGYGNGTGVESVFNPTGLLSPGASIRFRSTGTITDPNTGETLVEAGDVSKIYTIITADAIRSRRGGRESGSKDYIAFEGTNNRTSIVMELDDIIGEPWMPTEGDWDRLSEVLPTVEVVEPILDENNKLLSSSNPAIFETQPKENIDLNLYYEASNAFEITDYTVPVPAKVLDWHNCFSYGNGVESNRIRDDYNAVTIDKGPKVSTVLDEPYSEERRGSGFIFSQIYNSTSGINRLNQFIQAEPITKDLNPIYGTIQKLHARDTDLISLCEDKCLRVLANKDALYNADGNSNVTSNQSVLGQAVPYAGEFGISKNPESFSSYGFRAYFTDKNRGAVIRLSVDGITNIADKGMAGFFADNLRTTTTAVGSYDDDKDIYNLTLNNLSNYWQKRLSLDANYQLDPDCEDAPTSLVPNTTISFKESVDGWTSRKDFIQESGITLNNLYYTFKNGLIWIHGANSVYNNFYGIQYDSSFNVLINEQPQVVKGYSTLNYTGTASRIFEYQSGNKWYSIAEVNANQITPTATNIKKNGWYTSFVRTDLEAGEIKEFQKKEGKYFNYIKGTLIGCEPDTGGIGPCLDCGETPQDYILTVTIDEKCSTGSSTPPVPDSTIVLLENQRACDVANSGFSYVDQATALAAKCGMDAFFTDTVQGDYSLAQCAAVPNFKYFSNVGIVVGAQLYDSETNNAIGSSWQGFYLYRGSLSSPSDVVMWYLDPLNTAYVIPNDWYILEISANGTIASLAQYNTLAPCQTLPDTYWAMWMNFQVITLETGSHVVNLNNYSNALDSKCALEDLYQLTVDETSVGGGQFGIGFYFYSNIGFGVGTQLYNRDDLSLPLNSPGAHLLVRPPAENSLNDDVFIRDNGVSAPDSYEIVIVGSNGVIESITQYNTITGSCSEDPYEPIEGQDFRFIAKKTASPYFGLFDDTLTEVSSPYTFAPVPNHISSVVAKVSDNYNYMLTGGLYDSQPVYLSTDNGESWSNSTFSANKASVHISRSGQVMIIESGGFNNALIEVSNNFGDSFTTFNLDNIITLGTSVSFLNRVALSSGGKFITISVFANGMPANDNQWRILKSSDYGASFSDITDNVGFPSAGARYTVNIQDGLISGNGKYEIYFNSSGASRYSDDYGETFIDKNYAQIDWNPIGQISESGKYFMVQGGQTSRYSTDFGASETLLPVPNSSNGDIGVNSSGEFSFATGGNSNSMSHSNDFFGTFTTIGPVADVTKPFILVDVS